MLFSMGSWFFFVFHWFFVARARVWSRFAVYRAPPPPPDTLGKRQRLFWPNLAGKNKHDLFHNDADGVVLYFALIVRTSKTKRTVFLQS